MRSALWHHGPQSVTHVQAAALALPALVLAVDEPVQFALRLGAAALGTLGSEAVFAALRGGGMGWHGVTTALILAILAPSGIAAWQMVLVACLGAILGELVFGGRGFGVVSPAAAALALLVLSFPQVQLPDPTLALALAALPGAALLGALGLISLRVLGAVAVAALVADLMRFADITGVAELWVALAFGATFLICDPSVASVTPFGRWAYGALGGCLVVVLSPVGAITPSAVVFAALLSSLFAPVLDHVAMRLHIWHRNRRHG